MRSFGSFGKRSNFRCAIAQFLWKKQKKNKNRISDSNEVFKISCTVEE